MKKFAFMVLGDYRPGEDTVLFEMPGSTAAFVRVQDFDEAEKRIVTLAAEGYGAVELCGAFGEERARKYIELTDNRMAIGFVVHVKEQDPLFAAFFGKG